MIGTEWRLSLYRQVTAGQRTRVCFIMLNPSTADHRVDDPTIRRCIGFARRWGFGWLDVVNLYPLRATDPAALWRHSDPHGPGAGESNLREIRGILAHDDCRQVIAAWGAGAGTTPAMQKIILAVLERHDLYALGLTKEGHPRHPLYLKADAEPVVWRERTTPRPTT